MQPASERAEIEVQHSKCSVTQSQKLKVDYFSRLRTKKCLVSSYIRQGSAVNEKVDILTLKIYFTT